MFPFTRCFPMDCWQSFKASVSQRTFLFLFFICLELQFFPIYEKIWSSTPTNSFRPLENCARSFACTFVPSLLLSLPCRGCWENFFKHFLPKQWDQREVVSKICVWTWQLRDWQQASILDLQGMNLWNESLALHALLCTRFCCTSFWLAWEKLCHSSYKTFCPCRNKAGWLDSELNMFTHQYLQQSR